MMFGDEALFFFVVFQERKFRDPEEAVVVRAGQMQARAIRSAAGRRVLDDGAGRR
jgi:hypothetical protein